MHNVKLELDCKQVADGIKAPAIQQMNLVPFYSIVKIVYLIFTILLILSRDKQILCLIVLLERHGNRLC